MTCYVSSGALNSTQSGLAFLFLFAPDFKMIGADSIHVITRFSLHAYFLSDVLVF